MQNRLELEPVSSNGPKLSEQSTAIYELAAAERLRRREKFPRVSAAMYRCLSPTKAHFFLDRLTKKDHLGFVVRSEESVCGLAYVALNQQLERDDGRSGTGHYVNYWLRESMSSLGLDASGYNPHIDLTCQFMKKFTDIADLRRAFVAQSLDTPKPYVPLGMTELASSDGYPLFIPTGTTRLRFAERDDNGMPVPTPEDVLGILGDKTIYVPSTRLAEND